ncbi:MAG: hypothetical protein D6732_11360, partial [Methanobacteriota archaeon]
MGNLNNCNYLAVVYGHIWLSTWMVTCDFLHFLVPLFLKQILYSSTSYGTQLQFKFYRRVLVPKGMFSVSLHPEDLEAINGVVAYLRILNVPMKPEKPAILSRVNPTTIQIRDPFFGIIAKEMDGQFRIVDVDVKIELDFFPYSLFALEHLKELGFRCTRIGTVDQIPSFRCMHLRSLYISVEDGHFLALSQLHQLTQLEHLFLYIHSPTLQLDSFPLLKSLGIRTSMLRIDESFPDWIQNLSIQGADVHFITKREAIIYLRLTGCRIHNVHFPDTLPNLKRLSLISSQFMTCHSHGIEDLKQLVFLELDDVNIDEINLRDTPLMFIILKNLNWKYLPKIPEYLFALHLISLPN